MRRIMLLVTAAFVMAAMTLAMAMPAFATPGHDITNKNNPANPYAYGYSNKTETYIYTYKGPESPPGSSAKGGNPGYTGGTCRGPGC